MNLEKSLPFMESSRRRVYGSFNRDFWSRIEGGYAQLLRRPPAPVIVRVTISHGIAFIHQ